MEPTPLAEVKKAPARWSDEEEAQLEAAYRSGTPLPQIAEAHGRSIGAITSRLQQLDLLSYGPYTPLVQGAYADAPDLDNKGKHWTEDDTARLLVTHQIEGTPEALTTLATELGRTPRSLVLKLEHLGLITPTPNPNPQPKPKISKPKAAPKPVVAIKPNTSAATVKITVTPEFQTALASINGQENILILGSAGTGKSTFLKWLRRQLDGKKSYAILAPTGMAALNVGGQTIHSFFGFKLGLLDASSNSWHKPRNPKVFEKLDVLIIDEISMVRADTFTALDAFLRKYGPKPKQPFGGVQMVLMGDLCQLPPVVRNDEAEHFEGLFGTPFFFGSPAWGMGHFGVIEFTHIFRQTDAPFINLLNQIRHGNTEWGVVDALNKRLNTSPPKGAVILAARNRTVDGINQREMERLTGPAHTYHAILSGNADPNAHTTPAELTLKSGAHVMFTRNDPNRRWVNGSLGVVTTCTKEVVAVKLHNGETHVVEPVKWESTKYAFSEADQTPVATVAGTFTQLPLTLAWALTIHKAQGQTLENCVLDLSDGGAFAEGQLYVALSRARSLESLHLTQPIQQRDIRTNPAVLAFYHSLRENALT